jgi:hypothetical protein
MTQTVILTLSHMAVRVLEEHNRVSLEKERRNDGRWDVLMSEPVASALEDAARKEDLEVSDWIVGKLRLRSLA